MILDAVEGMLEDDYAFSSALEGGGFWACEHNGLDLAWAPLVESETARVVAAEAAGTSPGLFSPDLPALIAAIDAQPLHVQQALIRRATERHLARPADRPPDSGARPRHHRHPPLRHPAHPTVPPLTRRPHDPQPGPSESRPMPPSTDTQIRLAQHPDEFPAVTATISGDNSTLAAAILTGQGFRPLRQDTMVLARIDREEAHYAGQAARNLRAAGITVEITADLQEEIDTEWTWGNYPMPWLSRDEIREVSADAQKIHDDIVSGRLVIHHHAHDGWSTVAVGTYLGGESVHLHGENHLRTVALTFDDPQEAISEFHRLNTDAVRPGPAPATDTDTETYAARVLAGITPAAEAISNQDASGPSTPERQLVPV